MNLFVGCVVSVRETEAGRRGVVSVRGARVEVALDFVPEASVGDSVLIHAGVALSRMTDDEKEDAPCAWPCRDA